MTIPLTNFYTNYNSGQLFTNNFYIKTVKYFLSNLINLNVKKKGGAYLITLLEEIYNLKTLSIQSFQACRRYCLHRGPVLISYVHSEKINNINIIIKYRNYTMKKKKKKCKSSEDNNNLKKKGIKINWSSTKHVNTYLGCC